jgi:ATP-binding cassette subfamily C protein
LLKVSLDEFDRFFSGVIIDILPTDKIIKLPKERMIKSFITDWLADFKTEISFILLCLTIGLCAPLFNSALSNIFIDQIVASKNISWIFYISGALIISALLFGLILVIEKWHQYKFYTNASLVKSSKIINHILRLPLLFYFLRQKAEIVAVVSRVESVIALLAKTISSYLVGSFAIIICLIFMAKIDLMLTTLSILILIIYLITTLIIAKVNFLNEKLDVNISAKIYAYLISNIRNLETIKICSLEDKILKKYYAILCQKLTIKDKVATLKRIFLVLLSWGS